MASMAGDPSDLDSIDLEEVFSAPLSFVTSCGPVENFLSEINDHELNFQLNSKTLQNLCNSSFTSESPECEEVTPASKRKRGGIREEVESGQRQIWFEATEPIPSFVGREANIKYLQAKFQLNNFDRETQPHGHSKVTIIFGPAGIGKTEFTKAFATRLLEIGDFNVIWINAETKSQVQASFFRLARRELEISTTGSLGEEEVPVIVKSCYEFFCKAKSLFIFDNASSMEEAENGIQEFLPFKCSVNPRWEKPNIIITSRSPAWPTTFEKICLGTLSLNDGLVLLNKRMGPPPSPQIYEELLNELSCFPLAIQNAVSYIRNRREDDSIFGGRNKCSIVEFLNLFKQDIKTKELVDKFWEFSLENYEQTILSTWNIVLKKFLQHNWGSHAEQIMTILSFCAADKIPVFLFIKSNLMDSEQFSKTAIRNLIDYSQITVKDNFINIHRLTQKVIQFNLGIEESQAIVSAIRLIKPYLTALEEKFNNVEILDRAKLVLPHGIQICNYFASRKYYLDNSEFISFTQTVLTALNFVGCSYEAITFAEKFSNILEENLSMCDTSLNMLNGLGKAYITQFKHSLAGELYTRIRPISIEILGENHATTLSISNNLGYTLLFAGKYKEALNMYTETCAKCSNTTDIYSLTAIAGTATANKCLGNYALSKEIFDTALRTAIQNGGFGDTHYITMTIRYGLGLVLLLLNEGAEAYTLLLPCAQSYEARYGLEHSQTIETYSRVIEALIQIGKMEEAEIQADRCSEYAERVLGKHSFDYFLFEEKIAKIQKAKGKITTDEEMELHVRQLQIKLEQQKLDPNGSSVIHNEKNIAKILFEKGKYETALEKAKLVKEKQIHRWNDTHPDVKISQELIANIGSKLNRGVEGPSKLRCHYCGRTYSWKQSLRVHIKGNHLKNLPKFTCVYPNCGKTFSRKDNMITHTKKCKLKPQD